jgi:hypothetical protein
MAAGKMAADLGVPFVGRIPIYQPIREGSDTGVPLLISEPESPAGARSGGGGADGCAGVDRQLQPAHDSVDGGQMKTFITSRGAHPALEPRTLRALRLRAGLATGASFSWGPPAPLVASPSGR